MRPYKLTPEREAILRVRWAEPFVSRQQIARELRIAKDTLREWVAFLNLPARGRARKPPPLRVGGHRLVETLVHIAAGRGIGIPQIAERSGLRAPTIFEWQKSTNPTVPNMEIALAALGTGHRLEIVDRNGQVVS